MTQSIHGHEVLHMMLDSDKNFSKESLEKAIHDKFGTESTFHTCSKDGMSANELIEFLEAKGKFVAKKEGFTTEEERICKH